MATQRSTEGLGGFYMVAVSLDHGGLEWTRLASVGGSLGRRCTLVVVVGGGAVWSG
jgi:hypothetical protein